MKDEVMNDIMWNTNYLVFRTHEVFDEGVCVRHQSHCILVSEIKSISYSTTVSTVSDEEYSLITIYTKGGGSVRIDLDELATPKDFLIQLYQFNFIPCYSKGTFNQLTIELKESLRELLPLIELADLI